MPVLIVAVSLTEKESNLKTIVITMIPLLYRTYVHFGMNEIVFPIFQDIYKKKNKEKSLNLPSNNNILTLQRNLFFIPRYIFYPSILPSRTISFEKINFLIYDRHNRNIRYVQF